LIFVYHINTKIVAVETEAGKQLDFEFKKSVAEGLSHIAIKNPNSKIVWCRTDCKDVLNIKELCTLFHHDKLLLSFNPSSSNYISKAIGYVDESLFINVNKKVSFPCWQMSSIVGIVHASVLIELKNKIPFDSDFDYYLHSVAKLAMPLGLLCYSEPQLLRESNKKETSNVSNYILFRFVKQHYKKRWVFLLFFNLFLYERKLVLLAFLASFFYRKRNSGNINLENIKATSSRNVINKKTIDVIIPTIGRKDYLYDVLQDLTKQTHLPLNVIIVEQNPDIASVSELDYLKNQSWPFFIKHIFTHHAGACNARNLALNQVQSEWIFLADDDIRFENDFIYETFENINKSGVKAVSIKCVQNKEKSIFKPVYQWGSFGSGCSFVERKAIEKCDFNMGFEFGYGEDNDFGMQLRNLGQDVLYLSEPQILHLKAPMGGFRTKPSLAWHNDKIQPKPSPTVMLYQMKHNTRQQNLGYKTILFFKYYNRQQIKNPVYYLIHYRKQWNQSVLWANQLNQKI
jgi:glycosyltransferase involved in cell wall biosynthesis